MIADGRDARVFYVVRVAHSDQRAADRRHVAQRKGGTVGARLDVIHLDARELPARAHERRRRLGVSGLGVSGRALIA